MKSQNKPKCFWQCEYSKKGICEQKCLSLPECREECDLCVCHTCRFAFNPDSPPCFVPDPKIGPKVCVTKCVDCKHPDNCDDCIFLCFNCERSY